MELIHSGVFLGFSSSRSSSVMAALVALVDMATHTCCTAAEDICVGAMLRDRHPVAELLQIQGTES